MILSEVRKPEKLWADGHSEFYNKALKSLLMEIETEIYSSCSYLKAVFIDIFTRTLLHINKKSMFISGDGNWVSPLIDAVVTYSNNTQTTINMTSVDSSNKPEKVRYTATSTKMKPKLKVGDYVARNFDKSNIFSKGYTSNWNAQLFKVNHVLKTQSPIYKIKDIDGEIKEGKYYEKYLSKSDNKFASDTIYKYNQFKLEFDNIMFNQKLTNIRLDDMFTTGLRKIK